MISLTKKDDDDDDDDETTTSYDHDSSSNYDHNSSSWSSSSWRSWLVALVARPDRGSSRSSLAPIVAPGRAPVHGGCMFSDLGGDKFYPKAMEI